MSDSGRALLFVLVVTAAWTVLFHQVAQVVLGGVKRRVNFTRTDEQAAFESLMRGGLWLTDFLFALTLFVVEASVVGIRL